MKKLLELDNIFYGLFLGLLFPALLYGLMYGLTRLRPTVPFNLDTLMVIAIAGNVIIFRYFMVKKELDNTGKGMLMATVVYAFIFFYFFLDAPFS
jgi:hypothetical protein